MDRGPQRRSLAATLDGEVQIVFNLTEAAWPVLKQGGGSVINMASVSAWSTYKVLPGLAHAGTGRGSFDDAASCA
jgi:NAD(P)-dependent dehydrogenase (short-subunit alcohol dehydrogenase family)